MHLSQTKHGRHLDNVARESINTQRAIVAPFGRGAVGHSPFQCHGDQTRSGRELQNSDLLQSVVQGGKSLSPGKEQTFPCRKLSGFVGSLSSHYGLLQEPNATGP